MKKESEVKEMMLIDAAECKILQEILHMTKGDYEELIIIFNKEIRVEEKKRSDKCYVNAIADKRNLKVIRRSERIEH